MPLVAENPDSQPDSTAISFRQRCSDFLPWANLAAGVGSIISFAFVPDLSPLMLLLGYLFICLLALAISVFLHELAHAFVAARFCMLPLRIQVGDGKTLFRIQRGACTLELNQYIHCGMVSPTPQAHNTRNHWILLCAAGPLMDLALLALLSILYFTYPFEAESQLRSALMVSLLALGWVFFTTLSRTDCQIYGRAAQTDIGSMIGLFKIPSSVFAAFQRLTSGYAGSWPLTASFDPADIRVISDHLLTAPRDKNLDHWRDTFCTAWLLYQPPALQPLVLQLSADLLANAPSEITRQGTRGAVLVQVGDLQDGIPMLEEVFRKTKSNFDRAFSAAFLARAHHQLGNDSLVQQWLAEFTKTDPPPALQKRLELLFQNSRSDNFPSPALAAGEGSR